MTKKIEKNEKVKSLRTPKQQNYRDRLAKLLLSKDKSERYDILEKEKKTNKMYIESSRDGSLGKEIAFSFIENKKVGGAFVAENIKKFKSSDHKEIADFLIEKGDEFFLGSNIKNFEGLDHNDVVEKTIKKQKLSQLKAPGIAYDLLNNHDFEGLNKKTAYGLIEIGEDVAILENLKSFKGLDKYIFLKLLKLAERPWYGYNLLLNQMDSFEGLDKEVAILLIKNRGAADVFGNLSSFDKGIFDKELAKLIIKEESDSVAHNLNCFEGLDKEIADLLIKDGYIEYVGQNLGSFENLGDEIKNLLIEKGYELYVEMYPEKF